MKVRDVIRLWKLTDGSISRHAGSHRQFKHPLKPGRVTIAGKPSDEVAPGTLNSIVKQAGVEIR